MKFANTYSSIHWLDYRNGIVCHKHYVNWNACFETLLQTWITGRASQYFDDYSSRKFPFTLFIFII